MTDSFSVTRILCPTDFSPASDAALRAAEGIASRYGARLDLLHVWAPNVTVVMDAAIMPTPEQVATYVTQLEKTLAEAAKRLSLPADRVGRHLVQGTVAWRDITDFAAKEKFDLIVMSTHGRTGLSHLLLGSVTERVVRAAKMPVLTIPPPP
jgi:universal stress protein A